MQFGILGPLRVEARGQSVVIRPGKQRTLLAVLLVHANQVVSTDQLVDQVWNGAPPRSPTRTLHVHLSQLRRALHPEGDSRQRDQLLARRPPGYVLTVPTGTLDLHRFEELVEEGRRARAEGDIQLTAEHLGEALRLWRGPVLADVDLPALQHTMQRLEETRLAVLEERIDAELLLGRHGALIGELRELVDVHPMRERLCAQLLVALYRAGRQAEALASYAEMRSRLVEELGIEPGFELQRLQRQILEGNPALAAPSVLASTVTILGHGRPVPRQLPADVAGFTGRAVEVERLLAAVGAGGPVMISAIGGMGGVGKSALAIHVAHRLAERFPDGQLYVNLHGATTSLQPLEPLEVLGRFMRALGIDGTQIPTQVDEAAARFRSLVADRRLVVVLDDARDAAQVAPLLPAGSGSAVLVTSRRVLASLDRAVHLHLDVLPPSEAVALLGRLGGEQRIAAEPEAAQDVARWCGYLPLALRVAAARLAARPAWPVRALADRLADERRRLDELELGDIGTRASLDVSLRELSTSTDPVDQNAVAAFPLLGLPDGPDLSVPVVARLLDRGEAEAERLLERLADAQLVESPSPGRYRLHDLLRLYARDHWASRYPNGDQIAAIERVLRFYVATAWRTHALLRPGDPRLGQVQPEWTRDSLQFQDLAEALEWLEAERRNLVAAVSQATIANGELRVAAILLAQALAVFFTVRGHWQDCFQVNQTALSTARRLGDRAAEAQAQSNIGWVYWLRGRYDQAEASLQESLAISRRIGDRALEGASLSNLGIINDKQGRYDRAATLLHEGLSIHRELGDHRGEGESFDNLGVVHWRLGRYDQALTYLLEALTIARELNDRHGVANSLDNLGRVYSHLGRYDMAMACFDESLTIFRALNDRHGEAICLTYLGRMHAKQGQRERAKPYLQTALAIFEELQTTEVHQVRELLGI
jgi:DNA-binding SARP family transcriptional activator/tetratricopeptide (TPR) repeat protein